MRRTVTLLIAGFLLAYFAFTSGLVFELTKNETVDRLDVPYSIALSNYRTQIVGLFNNDDRACAKWLIYYTDPSIPIYTDYTGTSLILDYSDAGRNKYQRPDMKHYIFLTTWNTEERKLMFGWYEGLREYRPLPDLSDTKAVFVSGGATVYKSGGEW